MSTCPKWSLPIRYSDQNLRFFCLLRNMQVPKARAFNVMHFRIWKNPVSLSVFGTYYNFLCNSITYSVLTFLIETFFSVWCSVMRMHTCGVCVRNSVWILTGATFSGFYNCNFIRGAWDKLTC
jgi:hypothetical protein